MNYVEITSHFVMILDIPEREQALVEKLTEQLSYTMLCSRALRAGHGVLCQKESPAGHTCTLPDNHGDVHMSAKVQGNRLGVGEVTVFKIWPLPRVPIPEVPNLEEKPKILVKSTPKKPLKCGFCNKENGHYPECQTVVKPFWKGLR